MRCGSAGLLCLFALFAATSVVSAGSMAPTVGYDGMPYYGFGGASTNPTQPQDPIIGILTSPNPHDLAPGFNSESCPTYVQQTYVEWLASAGIRSVPLRYDMPHDELAKYMDNLNGAFFTGGGINFKSKLGSIFYNTAEFIVNYTMKANANGDRFTLWGTCQGFQLVSIASALDQSLLKCDYVGVEPAMLPLNFTAGANVSEFIGPVVAASVGQNREIPADVYQDMATRNTTANLHACGLLPEDYVTNKRLHDMYHVLSTNVDADGRPFASTIEHKTAAIYATQWHPEAAQFWYDLGLPKHPDTLRVSTYAANFLVSKLRNNTRSFPTPEEAFDHLITRFPVSYKPLAAYTGFYCLIEDWETNGTKHVANCVANTTIDDDEDSLEVKRLKDKARNWEVVGVLALVGLFLSLCFAAILYKFTHEAVKPDPQPIIRKKPQRSETERLINEGTV